uniref:CCHC-type domain-containing protein n=1 Tax=Triticum urartu TaxID=4572 RepID=A0A8R7NZU4_TRIUA
MELIMQHARVREEPEQTMQRFLSGLNYNIKRIVRLHQYYDMTDLLHQAREAELQVAEDAKFTSRTIASRGRFTPRTTPGMEPTPSSTSVFHGNTSSKSDSVISNAKKPAQPAASAADSTARNRDMSCHTCGGRGHFKRDCPNKKVMLINEDTKEYETGDDADP